MNLAEFRTHPFPSNTRIPYKIQCAHENSVGRRCCNLITSPNYGSAFTHACHENWAAILMPLGETEWAMKFYCCNREDHP